MKVEDKNKIEEIIDGIECPKDFKCVKSGFENLCKAKYIGLEKFLECLEENYGDCKFAFPFGYSYFCKCPVRVYIAKKLEK